MKNTKRALRRHHRQRMIARAMKSFRMEHIPQENRLQWATRVYNNLQSCSCWMCGHRRKWWGLTTQERRQLHAEEIDTGNEHFREAEILDVPIDIVPEGVAWSLSAHGDGGNIKMARLLLEARADPSLPDEQGDTPIIVKPLGF